MEKLIAAGYIGFMLMIAAKGVVAILRGGISPEQTERIPGDW